MKIEMDTILEDLNQLPTLPQVVTQILAKIDDPDASADEFQSIIAQDPIITAKVLKFSNSAYYGYSREISTVSESIVILGLDTLRSLVIALSAYNVLNRDIKGYGIRNADFWKHSLATAIITREIARVRKYPNRETYFVGGLLHDIGKLLLDRFRFANLEKIQAFKEKNGVPDFLAEKAILGYDHSEVGSSLADTWKFPASLVSIVRYHHWPLKTMNQNSCFVKAVHVADCLANERYRGGYERMEKIVRDEVALTNDEKKIIFREIESEIEMMSRQM